jgi:hypothetical protein
MLLVLGVLCWLHVWDSNSGWCVRGVEGVNRYSLISGEGAQWVRGGFGPVSCRSLVLLVFVIKNRRGRDC